MGALLALGSLELGVNWVQHWLMLHASSLRITPEVLRLMARPDEFKGGWRALGTLAPDRLSALRRIATIGTSPSTKTTSSSCTRHFYDTAKKTRGIAASTKTNTNSVAAFDDKGVQIDIVLRNSRGLKFPRRRLGNPVSNRSK